ncbi:MAG: 4-hydroxy-tetrahydrodipicolinate synthase [Chlorobium sp.]|jgi:4-hydroxy-tetrahydrodipicolinate synthase|uniref:4-hydroxy-tetrahydrodipicolinate synthase n=1 Tax=Chlorobium sp. TaxID=1095 RepID=UPI001D1A6CB3|nr:4-hydroxy-tetrahydrodipicolinate synthase [Chlorobium sp.]MBN1278771.1 4-hydroxy-tetrahydrodipicolinate synthase [Chlorobiaceae bacterium]MCF8215903.1 4-hydroxy-tetrahydrodipicolinate synthase [Chlorobium sp.]MCF8270801.1 4-hydroxy-tetrahydrodipicolinate synthase [Chlorobium sp.]MCF8287113.1 4-hydroxy-tetrahydrodipicolinate synthase [Chlorobium sp.]MCF8290770.1 4-hydroxy-tetrahydrodipicolinate synthase [Chlorobium sp.]
MSTRLISGSAVALVTPFKQDRSLDIDALKKLVRFHIEAGTDILIPCGTTGESPTLSEEEQVTIIRTVREEAGDRIMVAAGAGTNATEHAVRLAKNAEQAGASAILSVAPYYNKPSQEGFYQHYRHIAEAVSVPIIIYNVPGRTGSNVTASTIIRLARNFENIAAVKEASDNMAQITELLEERPAHFSVLTGEDMLILPFMAMGGDGVISVAANQVPSAVKQLVDAVCMGKLEEARAINSRYRRLFRLNFIESNPVPVKYALAKMGMIEEYYRLPLVPLAEENRSLLHEELQILELI